MHNNSILRQSQAIKQVARQLKQSTLLDSLDMDMGMDITNMPKDIMALPHQGCHNLRLHGKSLCETLNRRELDYAKR